MNPENASPEEERAAIKRRSELIGRMRMRAYTRGALIHAFAEQFSQDELGRMFDDTAELEQLKGQPWVTVADALGEAWASYDALQEYGTPRRTTCPVGVHDAGGCRA